MVSRAVGRCAVVASAFALSPAVVHAAEYYVSPSGSDSAAGTQTAPFATLTKANSSAGAGDTIWVRGGTYSITSQLVLSKSGTSDSNRTKIWAYPGEKPVLDASKYVTSNASVDVPVVLVTGSYMHLKGLEIGNAKVGSSGNHSYSLLRTKNASNNTFELLNLHHAFGPGLFIDTGTGSNLVLNCDSHDNYDKQGSQGDGENGDGFGVHYQESGPSTVIRGCRAWMNSDDGYDLIHHEVPVIVENSFAFQNGYAKGNGNGFKMGSSQTGIRHIVRNNVAWKNKAAGFYANHSAGGNTWYNNTAYGNGTQYNLLASTFDSNGDPTGTIALSGAKAHIMRNNVGFPDKNANMNGVDSASNTWDLGIIEASGDFASTDPTGCDGPREADGSLPASCTFMHLKSGSPLIDKGKDVGLPFVGTAPDLGAYEFGAVAGAGGTGGTTATGASGGSNGSAGNGGRTGVGGSSSVGGLSASGGRNDTGLGGSGGGDRGGGGSGAGASGGRVTNGGTVGATGGTTVAGHGGSSAGGGNKATAEGGSRETSASGSGGMPFGTEVATAGRGGATNTGASTSMAAGGGSGIGVSTSNGAEASGCSCGLGTNHRRPHGWWRLLAVFGYLALRRRRD